MIEAVEKLFGEQQRRGAFSAGQLVVQRGGVRLLDLALGAEPDTRFQIMSASKPVLARALALLEERGQLDVAAPVRKYIPDFAGADATVLEVMLHRSGFTMPVLSSKPELWSDWNNVQAALRSEQPAYPRGTLAYQPIAFGWILAEILQRITGESLQTFCARELPFDLQWIGSGAKTHWRGKKRYMLNGSNLAEGFEHVNNLISARTALVPGAGMYASARALAAFYASLLDAPMQAYTTPQTNGVDKVTGAYVVLGRGFAVGWRFPHAYGWWNTQACFGHAGGFGIVAYADRKTKSAVAIVTDTNRGVLDLVKRFAPLGSAIRRGLR